MDAKQLSDRMKKFAIDILSITDNMPRKLSSQIIAKQIIRSATSIGANYREACYARSKSEFISKVGICIQEANETLYWLEIIQESKLLTQNTLENVLKEADELLSILIASSKTAINANSKGVTR